MRLVLVVLALGTATRDGAAADDETEQIQVYLSPSEAIAEIFEDVASVDTTLTVLTGEEIETIRSLLGQYSGGDSLVVLVPRDADGDTLGYAVIDEEIGKYHPITFMVGTETDFTILGVEVLVYRESRGGEVRRQRFLRQYRGKKTDNPIRLNRDILNIAGATLSVRALNHGIKRVLQSLTIVAERDPSPLGHGVRP